MDNWIKKMNEMFEANEYTDDKRVTVDYCENAKCIFINVCGSTAVINDIDRFNDFGLMMECLKEVNAHYSIHSN